MQINYELDEGAYKPMRAHDSDAVFIAFLDSDDDSGLF